VFEAMSLANTFHTYRLDAQVLASSIASIYFLSSSNNPKAKHASRYMGPYRIDTLSSIDLKLSHFNYNISNFTKLTHYHNMSALFKHNITLLIRIIYNKQKCTNHQSNKKNEKAWSKKNGYN
jgi:hypothetical protein